MSSVWNVVRAANYNSVSENDENIAAQSPLPDKFKQKFTVNSLRMSLRKRMPLKRININNASSEYYESEAKKNKVQNLKRKDTDVLSYGNENKIRGVAIETSVKKTFYRVAEQFTGNAKKSQLKETPQKSTPRTRYRERLRSPPDTPGTPYNPFDSPNGPVCTTPIGQVEKLKRYIRNTPNNKSIRRSPRISAQKAKKRSADDFSHHLELVSCGIQHLKANSSKMMEAIDRIDAEYERSPLCLKMKRLWREERKKYAPIGEKCEANQNQTQTITTHSHSQTSNTKRMLRRTLTRMSFKSKGRPALRSTKSTSDINPHCYLGPMNAKQMKLAPLEEYKMVSHK
ncbi:uncharacterized protein LOC120344007 isoform X2 [Styela clava]|uniref:uncharacterized protein LOC120344007 isoform X2 n=1 Tax=Styela clava TaxID=7725 RepID=UPI00193A241F|nr:uncharacterized protein LOC120344007 isoform X2 [Styela clava]